MRALGVRLKAAVSFLKTAASWIAGGALAVLILPPLILQPLIILGVAVAVCGPALDDNPTE